MVQEEWKYWYEHKQQPYSYQCRYFVFWQRYSIRQYNWNMLFFKIKVTTSSVLEIDFYPDHPLSPSMARGRWTHLFSEYLTEAHIIHHKLTIYTIGS